MNKQKLKILLTLLLTYGVASLIHFIHNAEFLASYPNLPASWSPAGVYLAWIAITAVGAAGWFVMVRGFPRVGLLILAVYAVLGLDSLGHYGLAPMSDHTLAMNSTILFEVTAAVLVLMMVSRLLVRNTLKEPKPLV